MQLQAEPIQSAFLKPFFHDLQRRHLFAHEKNLPSASDPFADKVGDRLAFACPGRSLEYDVFLFQRGFDHRLLRTVRVEDLPVVALSLLFYGNQTFFFRVWRRVKDLRRVNTRESSHDRVFRKVLLFLSEIVVKDDFMKRETTGTDRFFDKPISLRKLG